MADHFAIRGTAASRFHFSEAIAPPNWQVVDGVSFVAVSDKLTRVLDGHPLYKVTCAGGDCAAALLDANLTDFPSLAGQSVHVAIQLRAIGHGASCCLEIVDGRDIQPITTTNASVGLAQWQTLTAFATLAWDGRVSVALRIFGMAMLEIGEVAIAPIGQD